MNTDLSVIIPVARMAGKLGKLSNFLATVEPGKVEIVVILDIYDTATSEELNKIISRFHFLEIKFCQDYYGSPGAARNAGLELATSEWIWFCDADDEPFIAPVLQTLTTIPAEIDAIIFKYSKVHEVNGAEYFSSGNHDLISVCLNPGLWRILLRKRIIHPFKFQKYSLGEDQLFILNIGIFRRKVLFVNELAYRYSFGGEGHLIDRRDKVGDLFDVFKKTVSEIKESKKEETKFVSLLALRQLLTLLRISSTKIKMKTILTILGLILKKPRHLVRIFAVIPIFLRRRGLI